MTSASKTKWQFEPRAVYLGRGREAIAASVVRLLKIDDPFSMVASNRSGWFGCEHGRKSLENFELP